MYGIFAKVNSIQRKQKMSENMLEEAVKVDLTIGELLSGEKSVLQVVENIGSKLQSTNATEREKAVTDLTSVLIELPPNFLSVLEVGTLVAFFCAKLKDSALLSSPCVRGIHYLCTQSKNFPENAEVGILKVLLREQEVQGCPQQDRFLIYQIVDHFLDTRVENIRGKMCTEFILGILQAIDGERDPRCLMTAFKLYCKILEQIPLGSFASDIFELAACYFPIDFRPPANDPYGIKPEQLSTSLRRCLTGHRSFANVCLELVTEKLMEDEDEKQQKECWILLIDAVDAFESEVIEQYADGLWQYMRNAALRPRSSNARKCEEDNPEDVNCLALKTLGKMTKVLSCNPNTDKKKLKTLVEKMFHDCEPFLIDNEMHLLKPASDMLEAAARNSESVSKILCEKVVTLLLERVQKCRTVRVYRGNDLTWDEDRGLGSRFAQAEYAPILASWIRIATDMKTGESISYLFDALVILILEQFAHSMQPDVVEAGYEIAENMLEMGEGADVPTPGQKIRLARAAMESFLIFNEREEKLRDSCCSYVRRLAKMEWNEVSKEFLRDGLNLMKIRPEVGQFLATIIYDEKTLAAILPQILNLAGKGEVLIALKAVGSVLKWNKSEENDAVLTKLWKPTFETFSEVLDWLKAASSSSALADDSSVKENCLNSVLARSIGESFQNVYLSLPSSSGKECTDWIVASIKKEEVFYGKKFSLFEPLLCSVPPQDSRALMEDIWTFLGAPGTSFDSKLSKCYRILCCLLNKLPMAELPDKKGSLGDQMFRLLEKQAKNGLHYTAETGNCPEKWGWLTRALLLRNVQPHGLHCLKELFDCLNREPKTAKAAVEVCQCVFDTSLENLLHPGRTRAIATLFYQQRILSQSVTVFLDSFNKCDEENKTFYFLVLVQLLLYAPLDTASSTILELAKLVPVLVHALQLENGYCEVVPETVPDSSVKDSNERLVPVISALRQLLGSSESAKPLEKHLESVTDTLISLSTSQRTMKIRSQALECLGLIGIRFSLPILYPLRKKVLKGLTRVLDDRKRLVRKNAADAKNKWCLYT